MTLQIDMFDLSPTISVAADQPVNSTFIYRDKICLRVKPVNFLLNSTLLTDCINKNKVFVVNLEKGTLFVIEGNAMVEPIVSNLTLKRKK